MILESLHIRNIRSYVEETITFSQGSQLLSGDIGSGKTTILLALEFALFGILRGMLSGDSLLRHGSREGSVTLNFKISDKKIQIQRNLKKVKDRVVQSAGFLIVDGVKQDLTAVELKDRILGLLGYPKTLLTKSKSLVYRYTVYTPQEEMKKIIFDDKETRLDTLRKVFDIEKYRRIKENASVYAKMMRMRCRRFEGIIHDLPEKEKKLKDVSLQLNEFENNLELKSRQVVTAKAQLETTTKKLDLLEQQTKEFAELKRAYQKIISNAKSVNDNLNYFALEQTKFKSECEILEKELSGTEYQDFGGQLQGIRENLEIKEKGLQAGSAKLQEFKVRHSQSADVRQKIKQLDNCPLCLQKVGEEHKSKILDIEGKKSGIYYTHILAHQEAIETQTKEVIVLKQKERELILLEKQMAVHNVKQKQLEEKKKHIGNIQAQIDQNTKLQDNLAQQEMEMDKKVLTFTDLEKNSGEAKRDLENKRETYQTLLVEAERLKTDVKNLLWTQEDVQKDVDRKKAAYQKRIETQKIETWITEKFINIISSIERAVFLAIYQQFNELFQTWFEILVDNDLMQARLDDSFTPIVEQNGYEIEVANLSGGEKTCCALAYRLALNKVINNVLTSINTRDLIILDEPTDGFSTSQLDKIRDVLGQVNLKQIVLVSHEPQIESFVEKVIRIEKHNHVSKVLI